MKTYDIIVIGGGPVGSYTAYQLADLGYDVGLFERDIEVGKDVICTGIVGMDAFDKFDLPRDAILHEMESVTFLSPSHLALDYAAPDAFACVIDRTRFDKGILQMAVDSGADVHLGKRVREVDIDKDFAKIETTNGDGMTEARAKVIVVATGVNYNLHRRLGLDLPPSFLLAMQTEAEIKDLDMTEVYLNSLPQGSFAWVVPSNGTTARIGALTRSGGLGPLKTFIEERLDNGNHDEPPEISCKPIAHGMPERSVNDRVIAVGEAAGQVKTTTGGGIFYGLMCSEIAVHVLSQAIQQGDLSRARLVEYEKLWNSAIGDELELGCQARKFASSLSRQQLDSIFEFIQRHKTIRRLIKRRINFDHHCDLLSLGMRLLRPFV
ncbi:MAG: NAD(P)/FAD-dependent oxidoreductase [Candidatus Eisenbacteria bacterium]